MDKHEIEQLADKYLNDIAKPRNPENWMEYITFSWMHNAEVWFCNEYEKATGFACPQNKIDLFKLCIYREATNAFDKKNGIHNGKYMVKSVYNDIERMQDTLRTAITMLKRAENPDNEYLPITEINDVIELFNKASVKLEKFVD